MSAVFSELGKRSSKIMKAAVYIQTPYIIAVLFLDKIMFVFDSHGHGRCGALIASRSTMTRAGKCRSVPGLLHEETVRMHLPFLTAHIRGAVYCLNIAVQNCALFSLIALAFTILQHLVSLLFGQIH